MKARIPPPLLVLFCGLAMWGLDRVFYTARAEMPLQSWLAGLLLLIAVGLMVLTVLRMLRLRTTVNPLRPGNASTLITDGVFSISRNPIYLGDLLLLFAWAVWLGNVVVLLPVPLFVWFISRYQIAPEEEALAARFGESYRAYSERVRRWL